MLCLCRIVLPQTAGTGPAGSGGRLSESLGLRLAQRGVGRLHACVPALEDLVRGGGAVVVALHGAEARVGDEAERLAGGEVGAVEHPELVVERRHARGGGAEAAGQVGDGVAHGHGVEAPDGEHLPEGGTEGGGREIIMYTCILLYIIIYIYIIVR